MPNNQSIPIIFAVTGHRDLCDENIEPLKEKVTQLFTEHKTQFPNTDLVLLSALAEGADMLVAEVAQALNIKVNVVLPYTETAYLKSFKNNHAILQFQAIKKQANKLTTLDCQVQNLSICYDELGKHLADNCNILIALFDGADIGKQGGTSEVIQYMRAGNNNNHFDLFDGNTLFTINTPRISNPNINNPFAFAKEFLSSTKEKFNDTLKNINDLNIELTKSENKNSLISNACTFFDKTASNKQKWHKISMIAILICTWVAFLSLEIMHVLRIDKFTWGYGIGLTLAYIIYQFFTNKGKIRDDFTTLRGLAEALRVQNAWNHAGLSKNVANYHLTDEHHKFTWMKIVIKNITYLDTTPFNLYNEPNYDECKWINGQVTYYTNALQERQTNLTKWETIERRLYKLGLMAMGLMFVVFIAEDLYFIGHGDWWLNWHYLVLVSGACLISAVFIGEKYLKVKGFKEEIYEFELMLVHFKKAQGLIKNELKGSEKYNKILLDLGRKALKESGKWVVLHDGRRAKFSVD